MSTAQMLYLGAIAAVCLFCKYRIDRQYAWYRKNRDEERAYWSEIGM